MTEFKDYITKKRPREIIYNDENNSDYMQGTEPLYTCLIFDNILITINPNIIRLKTKSGKMMFYYVQGISVDICGSLLGDVVTLYCDTGKKIKAYTLIVR